MKHFRARRFAWLEGVHFDRLPPELASGMKYELLCEMSHRGPHGLTKTMVQGMQSDGATCAIDLCPEAFFTHDAFCVYPFWDDGTPISNWGASLEYRRILKRYGFKKRSVIRHYATFLFGGGRIKKTTGWFLFHG